MPLEIMCPHCNQNIGLDDLNPLAAQVRDDEFRKAVNAAVQSERDGFAAERSRLESELAAKNTQIAYLSDMRLKLSTKMLGESLERHCEDEFNRMRAMAFPLAYFEKDNDASLGSKGDYIFRDYAPDGTEIISVMFEMKNESQETQRRHKNQDFFKELDKDRREKNCEYAVLVSMLEPESDFYNSGIADVGHLYPKMFVVRPQCFLTIIGLLRNMGLQSLEYKKQAAEMAALQYDFNLVEGRIAEFKTGFSKNCNTGLSRISDAIENIDKIVTQLGKTRDMLETAQKQFGTAMKKADGLTSRKITGKAKTEPGG